MLDPKLREFVEFAIKNEKEAFQLYEATAAKCNSSSGKRLLENMATMEKGHEAKLTKLLNTGESSLPVEGKVQDLHISDYLVEEEINADSGLQDIMIFSIKCEEKANLLYKTLADNNTDPDVKRLFLSLAEEEKKHKFNLECEYEKEFMEEN